MVYVWNLYPVIRITAPVLVIELAYKCLRRSTQLPAVFHAKLSSTREKPIYALKLYVVKIRRMLKHSVLQPPGAGHYRIDEYEIRYRRRLRVVEKIKLYRYIVFARTPSLFGVPIRHEIHTDVVEYRSSQKLKNLIHYTFVIAERHAEMVHSVPAHAAVGTYDILLAYARKLIIVRRRTCLELIVEKVRKLQNLSVCRTAGAAGFGRAYCRKTVLNPVEDLLDKLLYAFSGVLKPIA